MSVTTIKTLVRPNLDVSFWPPYSSEFNSLTNSIDLEFINNNLLNITVSESDDQLTHIRTTIFVEKNSYDSYQSAFNGAVLSNNFSLTSYYDSVIAQYNTDNNIILSVTKNFDS
jgi:hypothetical protein